MSPTDVLGLIDQQLPQLSPELQCAARWVQDHWPVLGLQSMRACARDAGVAPATMSRLARALGFEGFEALRNPFKRALAHASIEGAGYTARAWAQQREGSADTQPLQMAQGANVQSWAELNTLAALDEAAELILESAQVLLLGLRGSFGTAHHLHYACQLLVRHTTLAQDASGSLDDMVADLRSTDLLVVISQAPYARRSIEYAQRARHAGVPVLALTDHPRSPLARLASHTLLFRADSPSFFRSMTGAQALAEALVSRMAVRGGAAVLDRLAQRQAQLLAQRVYWEKPFRREPS
jgi:DNA-binding MurR/RpiR family transcriptional regulator